MGTNGKTKIGTRLKGFLSFAHPRLRSQPDFSLDRLKELRQLSDYRVRDLSTKQSQISLAHLSKSLAYSDPGPGFATLALQGKMLDLEDVAQPLPKDSITLGTAIDAILLQNVVPRDQLLEMIVEFTAAAVAAEVEAQEARERAAEKEAPSDLPPKMKKLLGEIPGLWCIPSNVVRLQKKLANPKTRVLEIAQEVELDPGLAAMVLRMVNSVHYGNANGSEFSKVHSAVVRLGYTTMQRVVMLAATISKFSKFKGNVQVDLKSFWGHSLWVAHAAERVCKELGNGDPQEHFSAGLLHDIGKLVEFQYLKVEMKKIMMDVRGGGRFDEVEKRVMGVTHAEIGACVCRKWKFPDSVVLAVEHHLAPLEWLRENAPAQEAYRVAGLCAYKGKRASEAEVAEFLGLTPGKLEEINDEAFKAAMNSHRELFQNL